VNTFEFYRFRFHFRALDPIHFPPGKSSNVVRGAFGSLLRETVPAPAYQRLFEPGSALGKTPSGLADWPRPFLFRTSHLDGLTVEASSGFHFDVHVFDLREPVLLHFREVFVRLAERGLGPGRGRASLEGAEQLDLEERATPVETSPGEPSSIGLDPAPEPVDSVAVRFLTPTELKSGGTLSERPEFGALFGRLRDRLSTLRALYGDGPMETDFRGSKQRAESVEMTGCELVWERAQRKSGRTGQVHSLGGFMGYAEYRGLLAEFLPWLHAARWVGVGRQTVWGKGDMRVVERQSPAGK
jgi:hypothetical protein